MSLLGGGFALTNATRSRVIVCYNHTWLLLITVLGFAGSGVCRWVLEHKGPFRTFEFSEDIVIEEGMLYCTLIMSPALIAFGLMLLSLARMFRKTRFAAA